MIRNFIFGVFLIIYSSLSAGLEQMSSSPCDQVMKPFPMKSLINSADFHPHKNEFCVAFTHANKVAVYMIDEKSQLKLKQVIAYHSSPKNHPQHAIYSKDGNSIVVANWSTQCFYVHTLGQNDLFHETPDTVFPFFPESTNYRPHGITFSQDGEYIVVAFGASSDQPKAIGLYKVHNWGTPSAFIELKHLLNSKIISKGIPKGVTFTPDGSCLVVTFADTNSFVIYEIDWVNERIVSSPKQVIQTSASKISRPEDIKISINGDYAAVSNSDQNTITFYPFDQTNNAFNIITPEYTLKNPQAKLSFPHGLAFSPDGKYLVVTQFGPVKFTKSGNLCSWGRTRKDSVTLFKLQ